MKKSTNPQKEDLKEKIIEILTPPAPPDARFHGGVKDWEYKYNKAGLDYLVSQILSLIEAEKKEIKCKASGIYSKDNDKNLHFYCEFCGIEMEYDEDRICGARKETPPQIKEDWEKSFDKEFAFGDEYLCLYSPRTKSYTSVGESVKDFISRLIAKSQAPKK